MNASIYAYSPDALRNKEHSTFFNSGCDAVVMADTGILDIDSEEDYELMQVIAKYLFENNEAFKETVLKLIDVNEVSVDEKEKIIEEEQANEAFMIEADGYEPVDESNDNNDVE
jgi:hypothetical protein